MDDQQIYANWLSSVLTLPRRAKQLMMVFTDAALLVFSLWAAYALRFSEWWPSDWLLEGRFLFALMPLIGVFVFTRLGLYRAVIRYVNFQLLAAVATGSAILVALAFAAIATTNIQVPRSIPIIFGLTALMSIGGSRMVVRFFYYLIIFSKKTHRVLIYGAGSAGRLLAGSLKRSHFAIRAFLDDDPKKVGRTLEGRPVMSGKSVGRTDETGVATILLAMPTLGGAEKEAVFDRLTGLGYRVITIPRLSDLASGSSIQDLRPLDLEDLLEREPVKPNPILLEQNIKDQCVLVTGAGGSIGSELCRQIIRLNPSSLVLLDHSEFMLFQINQELRQSLEEIDCDGPKVRVFPILGSTCDREQMNAVFSKHSVNTVFHAAAYKHVHLLEENVSQGVKNNVLGTLELIRCCESYQVDHAVLVSTDKAVRPSSVMGLSKRVSELAIQDAAARPTRTVFSIVRFGNVLGSNGSVIPIFRQQITSGGPVTVTDPEVTRYFMTIPEAASLVIQASALARGGDVFVLDMGDPVKIVSIAERLIKLAGRVPAYEKTQASNTIQVQFIGLKPGEKLHEELTFADERQPTLHPKIFRVEEPTVDSSKLATALGHWVEQADWDHNQLKGEMLSLVGDARFH